MKFLICCCKLIRFLCRSRSLADARRHDCSTSTLYQNLHLAQQPNLFMSPRISLISTLSLS